MSKRQRATGFTPGASGMEGSAKRAGGCVRDEYPPGIL
jgi:hypothetical protein